jgi:hypothetical protein
MEGLGDLDDLGVSADIVHPDMEHNLPSKFVPDFVRRVCLELVEERLPGRRKEFRGALGVVLGPSNLPSLKSPINVRGHFPRGLGGAVNFLHAFVGPSRNQFHFDPNRPR